MGALACLLKAEGHDVRGSDTALYPPMSEQLEQAEVPVFEGFGDHNLQWAPDVVVVGNVCSKDHPEVVAAQTRGIRLESFPSLLEQTLLAERRPVVVAGTHGKTTTSTMAAWLLRAGGRDPSWLIGGVPQNLGRGSHLGGGDLIVLEGDEYDTAFFDKKSKFLHYRPRIAVLTSVEFDHADIFTDLDAIASAFREFVALVPADGHLVVNADDPAALRVAESSPGHVITYRVRDTDAEPTSGMTVDYDVMVVSDVHALRMEFEVVERGESLGRFSSLAIGHYNVANFTAALAVARIEGCDPDDLRRAVRRFRGVKRRQDVLGVAQGVRVVEDFAHHPTAVRLTLNALRRRWPEKSLRVAFDPRSATSRRDVFFEAFSKAFDHASAVYVGPLHAPEKVPADQRLDTHALAEAITHRGVAARAFDSHEALGEAVLEESVPGDTVLFLTCGSFGGLPREVLRRLGDPVVFGEPADVPAIDALLGKYEMPPMAAPDEIESLVIRADDGGISGCVNLQLVGDDAYLFGLAVLPDRRGEGLGWVLADTVLRRSRILGVSRVYLITSDAADFFANRLGFHRVPIEDVDPKIRDSANFANAWNTSVTCMTLDLRRHA